MTWLQIAGLWAIAVAQPLFGVLAASPEFFVAHRASRIDVVLVAVTLAVLLPSLVAIIVGAIAHAIPGQRVAVTGVVVAALGGVLALQIAVRAGVGAWQIAIPLSLAGGTAIACARERFASVRTFLRVLSAAALLTPALFLLQPGVRRLLAAPDGGVPALTPTSGGSAVSTPVVLAIFDELPLVSLLDADGQIDRVLYPNIAALADEGVWYRNATTVSDFTRLAVPSILSGRYPHARSLPTDADYPDNLFTLLSRTHRLEVAEPVTRLCPEALCPKEQQGTLARLLAVGRDLRLVYLHAILTPDLAEQLPKVTQNWANFDDDSREPDDEGRGDAVDAAVRRQRWRQGMSMSRLAPIRAFIDGIDSADPQQSLYFIHSLVSHYPYGMLPAGKRNATLAEIPARYGGNWRPDQTGAIAQQYQRHLLQVGFVDRLVGALVARLKAAGQYDAAMIVVTADHGISFLPGAPQRNFHSSNAAEIMRVPLVIKYPRRLAISAQVSDVNAESIDILPTIAAGLSLDVPWPIDGVSLLNPRWSDRPSKKMIPNLGGRQEMGARGPDAGPALQRKIALFGGSSSNPHRAPRVPEFEEILGARVSDLRVTDDGAPVEILGASTYDDVALTAGDAVFDVAGRFAQPNPGAVVAVAVNGRIEALTRTWESNARGWLATPRFDVWLDGRNAVDVFVVGRDVGGIVLKRSSTRQVRPDDLNLILPVAAESWGVRQRGFDSVEDPQSGVPFRWIGDRAELANVFTHDPPRAVEIGPIRVPRGVPKRLKVEANDCPLFDGIVSQGWSATLSFASCRLTGTNLTLRFTTEAVRSTQDRRRLGVALTSVRLK